MPAMNPASHPKCTAPRASAPAPATPPAGFTRRDFLRLTGLSASAALAFHPWPSAMAGPFTRDDFERLVPADKKLAPEWLKSLTARGEREVYRGADLAKIGMPVGGVCTGQIYLGGDGRLWHWDIFNQHIGTGAEHYAKPMTPASPLAQGFALRVTAAGNSTERRLEAGQWADLSFLGEYPIGYVNYADPAVPVSVSLEAFSPFIPLNVEDSSLPATVLEFTLKNTGLVEVEAQLAGWLENAVCRHSSQRRAGIRRNRLDREPGLLFVESRAEAASAPTRSARPDIVFADFERADYGDWTASGTAFGNGPVEAARMPDYQGEVGARGQRLVNSHAAAPGGDVGARDAAQGKLTSRPFVIERDYVTCLIGGGNHKGKTCLNLLVEDQVVLSATGPANNRLQPLSWDVRAWAGKTARLEIVDAESGAWGNIGVDDIVFSDQPRVPLGPLADEADFGTMVLALLPAEAATPPPAGNPLQPSKSVVPTDLGTAALGTGELASAALALTAVEDGTARRPFTEPTVGALGRKLRLVPGASAKVTFIVAWHFPNLTLKGVRPVDPQRAAGRPAHGRSYASRFGSAVAVARYVARDFARLAGQTRLWHETWYDATLPYWFLDRTFLNLSILASSTCYRFADGRFWAWEGVGCCAGTCGHVWQYAQGMARIFPELERVLRERTDFGLALQPDGAIHFRGENNDIPAIDAQAGTILRALREHQMSPDDAFLRRVWPGVRRATEWLLQKDGDDDGIITGNQHNTLDTDWFGPVAWLSGLYLVALLAAAALADVMGEETFAAQCRRVAERGQRRLVADLFDGEYFINQVPAQHLDAINSGTGCEIDQVMGQSWAFQVGLPRVLPEKETRAALASLWRYNFTPDVGPYRAAYKAGRWYAMPGEAGLLMCSFPRRDWDYAQAKGKGPEWAAGYFNECMNGFEYQAASHMIWEGLVTEGLAVTRAVHDRYHPSRRNPFNEIECGDHYARSLASYGVFLAVCGFAYDGPRGAMAFAPRLTPGNFRCAFTTAEGWGTFRQEVEAGAFRAEVAPKWGQVVLRTLTLTPPADFNARSLLVVLDGKTVPANLEVTDGRYQVTFAKPVTTRVGQPLQVKLS